MLGMKVSAGHGLSGPLYRVDQVPEQFHEHFIVRGYRHPKSSFTQCLLSLFDPTNETLNFWTHFLPAWYFVWLVAQLTSSNYDDLQGHPYLWPLLCYLLTCCAFSLASSVAHLFNVMSERVRHICFFLDYAALSLFTFGSALAYRAYCLPAEMVSGESDNGFWWAWYRDSYIPLAICNSCLCTVFSCQSRFMKPSPLRKIMRMGSFLFPYFYDVLPLILRLTICRSEEREGEWRGEDSQPHYLSADYYHTRQFFFSVLAGFLYASHLPERILPGMFDIIGHSHQLFHVAGILAVLDQVQSVVLDVRERKTFLLSTHWIFDSPAKSLGVIVFIFFTNCLIIGFFILKLYSTNSNSKTNQTAQRKQL